MSAKLTTEQIERIRREKLGSGDYSEKRGLPLRNPSLSLTSQDDKKTTSAGSTVPNNTGTKKDEKSKE